MTKLKSDISRDQKFFELIPRTAEDWSFRDGIHTPIMKESRFSAWRRVGVEVCEALYDTVISDPTNSYYQLAFFQASFVTLQYVQSPQIYPSHTDEAAKLRPIFKQLRRLPDEQFLKLQYLFRIYSVSPFMLNRSLKDHKELISKEPKEIFEAAWAAFWQMIPVKTQEDGTKVLITDPRDRAWLTKAFATNPSTILWEDLPQLYEDLKLFKRVRRDQRWKDAEADLNNYSADTLRDKLGPFQPKALSSVEFKEFLEILHVPLPERQAKATEFIQQLEVANHINNTRNRIRRALDKVEITSEDFRIIHDGEEGMILSPLTEAGSRALGIMTSWCTAYENIAAFDTYNKKGPLWILVLPSGKKFQISLASNQFTNSFDRQISGDGIEESQELRALLTHLPIEEFDLALEKCSLINLGDFIKSLGMRGLSPFALQGWLEQKLEVIADKFFQSEVHASRIFPEKLYEAVQKYKLLATETAIESAVTKAAIHRAKSIGSNMANIFGLMDELEHHHLEYGFSITRKGLREVLLTLGRNIAIGDFGFDQRNRFLPELAGKKWLGTEAVEALSDAMNIGDNKVPSWLAKWTQNQTAMRPLNGIQPSSASSDGPIG